MTTGIYKLTFPNNKCYIGQSANIEERLEQHRKKLVEHTASEKMQNEYRQWGLPKWEVMFECHRDHLNFIEAAFIHTYTGPLSLNTTLPKAPTDCEVKILNNNPTLFRKSIPELVELIIKSSEINENYQKLIEKIQESHILEISGIKDGILYLTAKERVNQLEEELDKEKNRPWYKKIFN